MSAMKDLSVSHLHGTNGVTEKIRRAMYDAAKQFVYIGFLLWEVQEYKYYEEAGFANVYEYAEYELNFKKSSTKNFIAIAKVFGTQEYTYGGQLHSSQTMNLQPKYEKFNYSQLVELLAMSEPQRAKATPDMTVKQLRQLKKDKTVYCTINEDTGELVRFVQHHPKPETTGQTSGPKEPTLEEVEKENTRLAELYCTEANIVNVNGETVQVTHYIMQELCRLAGIQYIDYEDYEISIKMIE